MIFGYPNVKRSIRFILIFLRFLSGLLLIISSRGEGSGVAGVSGAYPRGWMPGKGVLAPRLLHSLH